MMVKKYRVLLVEDQQQEVKSLVSRGLAAAYRQTHARVLLLGDENQAHGTMEGEEIARPLKVGTATVERVRRRLLGCSEGVPRWRVCPVGNGVRVAFTLPASGQAPGLRA